MIDAVLFDLDGTLIDTAPDMGGALNDLLIEQGYPPIAAEVIRPQVSRGGLVLTRLGFADKVGEDEIEPLRLRFLDIYHQRVARESSVFEGFDEVLARIEDRGLPWGIVTNKPEWLTRPLLEQLDLSDRVAVVIGGDTLEKRKPDPMPLQVAAQRIGMECANCVYIGDDERDIVAGRAAGMKTLVAAYGYIDDRIDTAAWQADATIGSPGELLNWLAL